MVQEIHGGDEEQSVCVASIGEIQMLNVIKHHGRRVVLTSELACGIRTVLRIPTKSYPFLKIGSVIMNECLSYRRRYERIGFSTHDQYRHISFGQVVHGRLTRSRYRDI